MALGYRDLQFLSVFFTFLGLSIIFGTIQVVVRCKAQQRLINLQRASLILFVVFLCFCIGLLSVFSFIPWFVSVLCSVAVYAAIAVLWAKYLRHGAKRDAEYDYVELGDADPFMATSKVNNDFFWTRARVLMVLLLSAALITVTCVVFWSSSDICVAAEPVEISTRLTRWFYADPCANRPDACFVYVTFGRNASQSLVVFFHTGVAFTQPRVVVTSQIGTTEHVAQSREYPRIELSRYLYLVELQHLQPNASYTIIVGDGAKQDSYSQPIKVRTVPAHGTFNFVAGGDLGAWDRSWQLLRLAAAEEPYFVGLGGDLLYEDGYLSCYPRYDKFFQFWRDSMVTPSGYSIPLITAIGNHEGNNFGSTFDDIPFYHHFLLYNNSQLNYEYFMGNALLITLDTDVVFTPQQQATWIESTLRTDEARAQTFRLALYHAPLYPATRDDARTLALRAAWAPLFDRYNVSVAFENHAHRYKRTHLLRGGQKDDTGTLYIGDGSFGVRSFEPIEREYTQVTRRTSFFLSVTVTASSVSISAVNESGTFDSVEVTA